MLLGEWTEPDPKVYVFNPKGLKPSTKVAGFDMDSTLIVPKSGAKWPKGKGMLNVYSSLTLLPYLYALSVSKDKTSQN